MNLNKKEKLEIERLKERIEYIEDCGFPRRTARGVKLARFHKHGIPLSKSLQKRCLEYQWAVIKDGKFKLTRIGEGVVRGFVWMFPELVKQA